MRIVRAELNDLPEILRLQKLCYLSEAEIYNIHDIPPLTQTLEGIQKDFSNQFFLKAVTNNTIIGSVRAYTVGETCNVGRLIVHPKYQNQGLGTKLMVEIEKVFNEAKRFELFTGSKSRKNLHLYQKLGYKPFKTEEITNTLKLIYLEKRKASG